MAAMQAFEDAVTAMLQTPAFSLKERQKAQALLKRLSDHMDASPSIDAAVDISDQMCGTRLVTTKEEAAAKLDGRRKRGALTMVFVVDRRLLPKLDFETSIELWSEFFTHHTNGDERFANVVGVVLTKEQMRSQRNRIRISSYRWREVCGVGASGKEYPIPANYTWFLEHIIANEQMGWIDFVANIGANVPVQETLEYMGEARCPWLTPGTAAIASVC